MKLFLIALLAFASLDANAGHPKKATDCWMKNGGELGYLHLIVNGTLLKSGVDAYRLIGEYLSLGYDITDVHQEHWAEYSPITDKMESTTYTVFVGYRRDASAFIDEASGKMNPKWKKKVDSEMSNLMKKYPAIEYLECRNLEGPGVRVGG